MNNWTKEEISFLLNNFKEYNIDYISKELNKNKSDIELKLKELGFGSKGGKIWNKFKVLQELSKFYAIHHDLSRSFVLGKYKALVGSAIKYCGSYKEAIELLGIDYRKVQKSGFKWDKEFVIDELKLFYKENKTIDFNSLYNINNCLYQGAMKCFGSYAAAMEAAGFKKFIKRKIRNKESIKNEIVELYNKDQSLLTFTSMLNKDGALHLAAIRHFGSWRQAVLESGIDYNSIMLYSGHFLSLYSNEVFDSYSECFVYNIFYNLKRIKIIKEIKTKVKITSDKSWTCDFVINFKGKVFWVEYDGLLYRRKNPYINNNEKIDFYIDNEYNLCIIEGGLGNECFDKICESIEEFLGIKINENIIDDSYKNIKTYFDNQFIISDIKRVFDDLGKFPTCNEYDNLGCICSHTAIRNLKMKWSEIAKEHFDIDDISSLRSSGENNARSKLSEKDVINIHRKYNKKNSIKQLEKEYNVSRSTIKSIIKKETWKHLWI